MKEITKEIIEFFSDFGFSDKCVVNKKIYEHFLIECDHFHSDHRIQKAFLKTVEDVIDSDGTNYFIKSHPAIISTFYHWFHQ